MYHVPVDMVDIVRSLLSISGSSSALLLQVYKSLQKRLTRKTVTQNRALREACGGSLRRGPVGSVGEEWGRFSLTRSYKFCSVVDPHLDPAGIENHPFVAFAGLDRLEIQFKVTRWALYVSSCKYLQGR